MYFKAKKDDFYPISFFQDVLDVLTGKLFDFLLIGAGLFHCFSCLICFNTLCFGRGACIPTRKNLDIIISKFVPFIHLSKNIIT